MTGKNATFCVPDVMTPDLDNLHHESSDGLLHSLGAVVWEATVDPLEFTFVSDHAEVLVGYEASRWFEPDFWPRHVHPDDLERVTEQCEAAVARGQDFTVEYRFIAADDRVVWLRSNIRVFCDERGTPTTMRGFLVDITAERGDAARLARAERLFAMSFNESPVAMCMWAGDDEGRFLEVNDAFAALTGYSRQQLCVMGFRPLVAADHRRQAEDAHRALFGGSGDTVVLELPLLHASGREVFVSATLAVVRDPLGRPMHGLAHVLDISDQVAARDEHEFADAVMSSVAEGIVAVDDTGAVTFVNPAGEALLGYEPGELLGRNAHESFHHTDEHGNPVAAHDCPLGQVMRTGRGLTVDDSFITRAGTRLPVSVTSSPLHRAGGRRGAVLAFRDISDRKAAEQRISDKLAEFSWLERIRRALATDSFVLYGQPIIDLPTGETTSHELLLRMIAEDGTIIAPGEFLPAAEAHGLIVDIDRWVIAQAAPLAASGQTVQVNLSARSMDDETVLDWIASQLDATGADPANLIFELTETAFVADRQRSVKFVSALTEMGCLLALDDFGTGYGSFTYLKDLTVSHLKIDREFVSDLQTDSCRHVISAIVSLAAGLGLTTVAEGVEDEPTAAALRDLGVHHAQGYYFGRPAPLL